MFRVTADSLESYLDFDPARKPDLLRLHDLIRKAAPGLRRYFHKGTPAGEAGMRMKMIGYGKFRYAIKSGKTAEWPVIGVALQKNYISMYVRKTPFNTCRAREGAVTSDLVRQVSAIPSDHLGLSHLIDLVG